MVDLTDYIQYFQRVSNEHVDINDFYIMDINEPVQAFKNGMEFPCLILNSITGAFKAPNLDNTLDAVTGGFAILGNIPNTDDFHAEVLLLTEMKQIGLEVVSRILRDTMKCEERSLKAFPGFDINSLNYEMLGPIFDNCFGFNFTFRLISTLDLSYNQDKWNENRKIPDKEPY